MQEIETKEETQDTQTQIEGKQEPEPQETTETVEETENYNDYAELVSVPVDGRDGSQENPYQVGDEIYFPKLFVGFDNEEAKYSSLSVSIEEATEDYIKISFKFGDDFWDVMYNDGSFFAWSDMDRFMLPLRADKEFKQVGTQCSISTPLNNTEDLYNFTGDAKEAVWYWQDFDGKGCIEGTDYIMLTFLKYDIPYEETESYFNCTFIEVPNSSETVE